jgi:hypothetical protein
MPLPDDQLRDCLRAAGEFLTKRRPPPEIRNQLDYRVDINGQAVTIVSLRPAARGKASTVECPIAKARWVQTKKIWRLYWMRGDLKWHSYDPLPEAQKIGTLLAEVDRDPHCCFFG